MAGFLLTGCSSVSVEPTDSVCAFLFSVLAVDRPGTLEMTVLPVDSIRGLLFTSISACFESGL